MASYEWRDLGPRDPDEIAVRFFAPRTVLDMLVQLPATCDAAGKPSSGTSSGRWRKSAPDGHHCPTKVFR